MVIHSLRSGIGHHSALLGAAGVILARYRGRGILEEVVAAHLHTVLADQSSASCNHKKDNEKGLHFPTFFTRIFYFLFFVCEERLVRVSAKIHAWWIAY
jgi:hypothetical protein